MKKIISIIAITSVMSILFCGICNAADDKPVIQLAILLDTSNSMDGLIDQAKTQLWKIVNELARSKRNNQSSELQVALYEYGNDGLPAQEGYLRLVSPLSRDLDLISEELFNLRTNGGSEYCGTVIGNAVDSLSWSPDNKTLKLIFIAGNEPFTQGSVDYQVSCRTAIEKGIIVNTIFCGNYDEGVNTKWKHGADLADGKFITLDQNQKIQHIDAPQDTELARLSEELNKTYLAYGQKGEKLKKRQEAQDANAMAIAPSVMAQRTAAKASGQYVNTSWDLVDADKEGAVDVKTLDEEQLPEEMKSMTSEEREKYLEEKAHKREEIQKQIRSLNEERRKYVAEQMKNNPQNTLDAAIINAIHDQAKSRGLTFE